MSIHTVLFSRQVFLPRPGGGEGFLDGAGGFPAHFFVREGRIRPNGDDVAGAAGGDAVVDLHAVHFLERLDQFHHGEGGAGADVEDLAVLLHLSLEHPGDGEDMGLGEVHDVDEVTQAGAVGGGIVVAEDGQALTLADGGLGDEGDEVVGNAAREFADEGARVRADGVEVAQEDALDGAVGGFHGVLEDVLAHGLGVAVRRDGRLAGCLLGHGHLVRLAVHGGGGGEQDVEVSFLLGGLQHVHEAQEVVLVVHEGLLHGFAHGLVGGEVDDGVDGIVPEYLFHGGFIAEIHFHEREVLPAGDLLHAFETGMVTVGEIVGYHHIVARLDEFHGHVASDEARSARNKNCFLHELCV